jgi:hypothetical protein
MMGRKIQPLRYTAGFPTAGMNVCYDEYDRLQQIPFRAGVGSMFGMTIWTRIARSCLGFLHTKTMPNINEDK